jgi:hypothetical protein
MNYRICVWFQEKEQCVKLVLRISTKAGLRFLQRVFSGMPYEQGNFRKEAQAER